MVLNDTEECQSHVQDYFHDDSELCDIPQSFILDQGCCIGLVGLVFFKLLHDFSKLVTGNSNHFQISKNPHISIPPSIRTSRSYLLFFMIDSLPFSQFLAKAYICERFSISTVIFLCSNPVIEPHLSVSKMNLICFSFPVASNFQVHPFIEFPFLLA